MKGGEYTSNAIAGLDVLEQGRKVSTVIVKNTHEICRWKSRSWLETGT